MVKAISPGDVPAQKKATLPDFVLDEWNKLLAEKSSGGGSIHITQDEIIARLMSYTTSRQAVFANHWLDIEPIYEEAGWTVKYDKPGYNEDYRAFFKFTPK